MKTSFKTLILSLGMATALVLAYSCNKDDEETTVSKPTVTTAAASSVAMTSAVAGGNVTNDGGGTVTERGVCWGTAANPTIADNKVAAGAGKGTFTANISGLTGNTQYYVRAYATNSAGTSYGSSVNFTTTNSPYIFSEDFQGGSMPTTFTLINDGNSPATNISSMFPNAWDVITDFDDTTNFAAASPSWFTAVAAADRWMITPAISVGANMSLYWKGQAQDPDYPDGYKVMISETGKNKADFTTTAFTIGSESDTWADHNYSLSAFAGKTIYVAFVQNSTDMFFLMIDDIKVGTTGLKMSEKVSNTNFMSQKSKKLARR